MLYKPNCLEQKRLLWRICQDITTDHQLKIKGCRGFICLAIISLRVGMRMLRLQPTYKDNALSSRCDNGSIILYRLQKLNNAIVYLENSTAQQKQLKICVYSSVGKRSFIAI